MKKNQSPWLLISLLILAVLMTGSKCDGTPDDYKSDEKDAVEQELKEKLDYTPNMTDDEQKQMKTKLENMTADEFNTAVDNEITSLNEDDKTAFLEWLKSYHLVADGCEEANWELPSDFSTGSMEWPSSIPAPQQGTVVKTEQNKEVTRVQIKNITVKTYEEWKSKLDEEWSFGCAVLKTANEKLDKAKEYIDGNIKYNLGEDTLSAEQLYEQENRQISESIVFTDEHYSKWLEINYGNNMAVISYTNSFTGTSNTQTKEKTTSQKTNEAILEKVGAVNFPGLIEEQLIKYTPIGKTLKGNIGQVLLFEGGSAESSFNWMQNMVEDGWTQKLDENEDYMETSMQDIDSTEDFIPDTQGFTSRTTESYFEKQIDNTVFRMSVITIETCYSLSDEIDVTSEKYKRWTIITINGIDIADLESNCN